MIVVKASFNGILRRVNVDTSPEASPASVWHGVKRATKLQHGIPVELAVKAVDVEGRKVENESDFMRLVDEAQASNKQSIKLFFSPDDAEADTFEFVTDSQLKDTDALSVSDSGSEGGFDKADDALIGGEPDVAEVTAVKEEEADLKKQKDGEGHLRDKKEAAPLAHFGSQELLVDASPADPPAVAALQEYVQLDDDAQSAMSASADGNILPTEPSVSGSSMDTTSGPTIPDLLIDTRAVEPSTSVISTDTTTQSLNVDHDYFSAQMEAATSYSYSVDSSITSEVANSGIQNPPAYMELSGNSTGDSTGSDSASSVPTPDQEERSPSPPVVAVATPSNATTIEEFMDEVQPLVDRLLAKLESRPEFIPQMLERFGGMMGERCWGIKIEAEDGGIIGATHPARQETQQPKQEQSPKKEDEKVSTTRWHRVICDHCQARSFTGFRFKCLHCPDFDLCQKCYDDKKKTHDEEHEFAKCAGPDDLWSGVTCDGCSMRSVVGKRFKCRVCPDYDLCNRCFNNSANFHPNHLFTQMVKSAPTSPAPVPQSASQRKKAQNLATLRDMGFRDVGLNEALLEDFDGDVGRVVEVLGGLGA